MANTTTATCLPLFPSLEMAWRPSSKCCARTRSSLPARRTVAAEAASATAGARRRQKPHSRSWQARGGVAFDIPSSFPGVWMHRPGRPDVVPAAPYCQTTLVIRMSTGSSPSAMSRGTIRTHAGPIRIASSIRADMIFGKDRGDHADVRPRRFGRIGTSRRHPARACRRRSAERGRAVRLLRFIPVVVAHPSAQRPPSGAAPEDQRCNAERGRIHLSSTGCGRNTRKDFQNIAKSRCHDCTAASFLPCSI